MFAFRRAETELPELNSIISGKDIINDDLMGEVPVSAILSILRPMIDSLSKKCVEKSQIHVFRFLQTLENFDYAPPSLLPRIKLCKVISSFDNFRRAIVHCDLLGDSEEIVSSLVLNHSLQLGQAAAECLGISSASATKQWLIFQYSIILCLFICITNSLCSTNNDASNNRTCRIINERKNKIISRH